jgi:SMI1-KNR4 cell-wall
MKLRIDKSGPPIGGQEIQGLESELGVVLPDDYKTFLLRYNGGNPWPNVVDIPDLPGSPTDVQIFFGLRRAGETNELHWNLALVRQAHLGRVLLPIACDSGGGLFCLAEDRKLLRKVIYLDMITSDHREPIFVAESFEKFLGKLRPFES